MGVLVRVLAVVLAYLLGSIPFGYLAGRYWHGVDIRQRGSGNIGTTNAFRVLGKAAGSLVFVGDLAKGLVAVLLGTWIGGPVFGLVTGLAAVLGHNYSVFLGFRGGRGVATSAGAVLAAAPVVLAASLAVWLATLFIGRYVSLASIMAAASLPVLMAVLGYGPGYVVFGLLLAFLMIYGHRPNLQRLARGTEPRLHFGKKG
ncbi:MAG: glycerol-3-phosphate 1-O-acyltransferase [Clostridia bacterium]|nr:MAG: glycerol-3-phosphate 1-O-acyltransferase [Clostridia bacterium]